MEFLNLVVESFFWALLIWLCLRIMQGNIQDLQQQRLDQARQELDSVRKLYRRVKIDQLEDMFYIYDADTEEFIAQGRSTEDFVQRLGRIPTMSIVQGEPRVIAEFKKIIPQDCLG